MWRSYRELELRTTPRSSRDNADSLAVLTVINQVWSMEFMSDALKGGRSIRTFKVTVDSNWEGFAIDFGISLHSHRERRSLL